jgi:IgGFc binding protein/Bacterial Ig-like domain (group 1)
MAAAFAALVLATAAFGAAPSSQGTDFWVTFESNCATDGCGSPSGPGNLYLFISGGTATSGTVTDPGISFSQTFTVTPGSVTSIQVPSNAEDDSSDSVDPDGVHITAGAPVSAYGLNTLEYTTDGYMGLPTNILGTSYLVEGYGGGTGSQFAVLGTQAGTTVTITPSETVGSHAAGTPYTVNLGQGQVYQLIDESGGSGDLSGTSVTSNNPVAVFAGNDCADVPPSDYACNTLAEEMTPTDTWGTGFYTEPLATRSGDTFRIMASKDGTNVDINGSPVASLNAGRFYETTLTSASSITANNPIQVMQYSNGESYDGANADPFDITIPPYAQYLNSYTVTTEPDGADPAITNNYIDVVAPTSEVGQITLDGSPIPSSDFSPIAGSSYSGAQVSVAFGSHTLNGPDPFGVTVYGYGGYDGYGYPGGFTLSPIAVVTNVSLNMNGTGQVGTQACGTATVTDQNGNPVPDVNVEFTVTGANPQTGYAYTDTNGNAQFCYTGTNAGTDKIVASVQTIQSNAGQWVWTPATAPTSITTQLSQTSVTPGTPVTDSATLTGANVGTAGGTVTYTVYSDAMCTQTVGTANTVSVTSGSVPNSPAVSLTTPGTYYWVASYSGDSANQPSASTCGSETETVATPTTAPVVDDSCNGIGTGSVTNNGLDISQTNELVVAYVAADGPAAGGQSITVSGSGLTWTRVAQENGAAGDAEVWVAKAGSKKTVNVTAKAAKGGYHIVLEDVSYKNATGVGAHGVFFSASGAPSGAIKTTQANSWVWGVGFDWANAKARTVGSGQTLFSQNLDKPSKNTFWTQSTTSPTPVAGTTVTINDTAPTGDPYDLVLVEIL